MASNLERLKAAYQLWDRNKGDSSGFAAMMADDFRLASVDESSPGLAFARDRSSKEDALAYMGAILKDWEMIHYTPADFVSEGDLIAVFGTCAYRNRRTGKAAEVRIACLWRFEGDRLIEMNEVFDSAAAAQAAV